ncbi:MAG: HD domain-containing protein [Desulfobacterota bacterium]|nr:HD domain-containing protein [Thermodesulfobacteriota bacterium]MDW8001174.1 HD domain-containing protein [Deltaproteobacteria bacterium]
MKRCKSRNGLILRLKNLAIIDRLKSRTLKGKVYLVGGAVRDLALGKIPNDFDLVLTDAEDLEKVEEIFERKAIVLGKKPLHIHRICTDYTIDITIADKDIEDDLKRRDLTINAMGYDVFDEILLDPLGGFEDLISKIIRFSDEVALISDPLRMLKGIRHYATLKGFSINSLSREMISRNRKMIRHVAGERIKYELDLILRSDMAYEGLKLMEETGLLFDIFPEFIPLRDFDKQYNLRLKVLNHTLYGLKFLKPLKRITGLDETEMLNVAYALLFHDLGKPVTFSLDEKKGIVHFFGHEKISQEMARKIMERLRFSNSEIKTILTLVKSHMWIFLLSKESPTDKATRRLILRMGDLTPSLVLLTLCDMFGTTEGRRNETTRRIMAYAKLIMENYRELKKEPPPKLVDGYDLLSLGYEEGPYLGKVLKEIREKQISMEIKSRDEALEYAKKCLIKLKSG